ncbi:MAG: molybdopterin molybdenumtransferase MoeA, partial [Candidatus Puniceispirillaceae bacterium]
MTELKPVAEAQEAIFSMMGRAPGETTALQAATGRILAEDISALIPHPAADISAMDGYAVQSGGTALLAGEKFQITGESAAGHIAATAMEQGQAMRIFTGAYLPEGADAIALQEDIRKEGEYIILQECVKSG